MSAAAHSHDHAHDHGHDHHELGFVNKYIFSTDHKVIGIQYAITGLLFLLFGFFLMMLMRWSIAYPGQPIPGFDVVSSIPGLGWVFNLAHTVVLETGSCTVEEGSCTFGVELDAAELYPVLGRSVSGPS